VSKSEHTFSFDEESPVGLPAELLSPELRLADNNQADIGRSGRLAMHAIDQAADEVEALLPRRGRRPVAWVQDAGIERTASTQRPFVDVAVIDWDAAAAVAEALRAWASLSRQDWIFRWRRTTGAFRVIRVYRCVI
jgi:hypothetical protein